MYWRKVLYLKRIKIIVWVRTNHLCQPQDRSELIDKLILERFPNRHISRSKNMLAHVT
jgi:hypothetical protein